MEFSAGRKWTGSELLLLTGTITLRRSLSMDSSCTTGTEGSLHGMVIPSAVLQRRQKEYSIQNGGRNTATKSLVIVVSYHHKSTEKIANVFARVLETQVKTPGQIRPEELQEYDLIGFGSGIYDARHHADLLDLASTLAKVTSKKAFIFSTSSHIGEDQAAKDHSMLREELRSKGYVIVDEFSCKGFNTNGFLRYFGGMNKGRPNAEDIRHAEEFAMSLKKNLRTT